MYKRITTASLTIFDAKQLHAVVSNFGDFEHVQLNGGPFRGQLMRSHFGDRDLDMVLFSQDVLVRGSYPADRITLALITYGREAGYFNGMRFGVNDIMVVGEGAAMDAYRLPAGTQLVGFQTYRSRLQREGIAIPARSGWCVIRGCAPRRCSSAGTSRRSSRRRAGRGSHPPSAHLGTD